MTQTAKPTVTQQRKSGRDAFFKLNVELNKSTDEMIRQLPVDKLEDILTAYMTILGTDSQDETIEVGTDVMRQMALLASMSLSRLVCARYK